MTKPKAKPVPQMSAAEIAQASAQWDAARAELAAAGDLAAAAQKRLDELPQEAGDDERQGARELVSAAEQRVAQAKAAIEALKPLPGIPAGSQIGSRPADRGPGGKSAMTAPKPDAVASASGADLQASTAAAFLSSIDALCGQHGLSRDEVLAATRDLLAARQAAADAAAVASGPRQVLRVVALQPSRWRARREFTRAPKDIVLTELSAEDRAEIEADPKLAATIETVTG